jgi:hypothetical protein
MLRGGPRGGHTVPVAGPEQRRRARLTFLRPEYQKLNGAMRATIVDDDLEPIPAAIRDGMWPAWRKPSRLIRH